MLRPMLVGIVFVIGSHLISDAQALAGSEFQHSTKALEKSKVDTNRVRLLLEITNHYVAKLPEKPSLLDSALLFIEEATALSSSLKYDAGLERSYLAEAKAWIKMREVKIKQGQNGKEELNQAHEVENKLISFNQTKSSPGKVAETYCLLAGFFADESKSYPEKLRLYESAISYFQKSGNKKRESETLYDYGFRYNLMGQLSEAQKFYLQSIAVGQQAGRRGLHQVYGTLGNAYIWQGNYKAGLQYILEAARIAESENDTTSDVFGVIHLYLGMAYDALKDRPQALKYYRKAYAVFEHYYETNLGDLSSTASNIARILIYDDPRAAIVFIEDVLKKYPRMASHSGNSGFLIRLMQAHMMLKEYDKGQPYCDQLMKMAETLPPPTSKKHL